MDEEEIGNARKPFECLSLVGDDRLAAPVAAGRHDGKAEFKHQQSDAAAYRAA